ncbi:hypothetical protein HN836_00995, partial [Candidatus Woesearchaeota archaeon]|nr:hypothetical protein [Candidatus Woesearchaeota archaeon]
MIDLLKKIYELKKCHNIPKHIAIIMDGNRRYAINNNLNKIEGHGIAIKMMQNVLFPTIFDKLKIPVKEFS